jgi:hypothetical protein
MRAFFFRHWGTETVDRVHAMALAGTVHRKGAQGLLRLATTNPALLDDWLQELTRCCDHARDEVQTLSAAVELLLECCRPSALTMKAHASASEADKSVEVWNSGLWL